MSEEKGVLQDDFSALGPVVHFVLVDSEGRIAQAGTQHLALATMTAESLGMRLIETEDLIKPEKFYVKGKSQFVPLPERPSRRHKFDFKKKKWEVPSLGVEEDRAAEYPDWREFADAFYWSHRGKPEKLQKWLETCDAVKQKFSKV